MHLFTKNYAEFISLQVFITLKKYKMCYIGTTVVSCWIENGKQTHQSCFQKQWDKIYSSETT